MPVEINELVIRAVVEPGSARAGAGAPQAGAGARQSGAGGASQDEQEALVQATVREVLKVLRRSQER